ncbi:MAG: hypothetical protein KJZ69_09390 [Phycisphaerales bacterium]|nr:hypothetical protein [Phycisphaerales bacterium]
MKQISDKLYEGESRLDQFGRSLIFRAPTREWKFMSNGMLEYAVWDFDETSYAEIRAGWPMRAWSCRNYGYHEMTTFSGRLLTVRPDETTVGGIALAPFSITNRRHAARAWRALPYQPLWDGVVVNTLCCAALLASIAYLPRWVRGQIRHRRGQCPACAYPRGTSPVCTECGEMFER